MAIGEAIGSHGLERAASPAGHAGGESLPGMWRAVLEQSGGRFDESGVIDFGQAESEGRQALSADIMADLSHYGLIEVRGDDAQKFLASLFTGDVRLVSSERSQFTTWCDAKGRAQATFWLFLRGGAYYLLLPRDIVKSVLAGLKQYLLRVKVTLTDASDSLLRLGLSGPGVESRLTAFFGAPPPLQTGETRTLGDCTLMAITGQPYPRWLAVGSTPAVTSLWQNLVPAIPPVGRNAWSLLDILAGIPLLVSETAGEFIPQMLNIEALGGLCFTKGCYPGQEVIARLHYRGQVKRRLYLAYVDSKELPPSGTKLHGDGATESVGTVVSAARHPDGRVALLGVVKIEEKAQGEVRLVDSQGPGLRFLE
ncbi:folate-binding protein [Methylocaldum sp.]|uniref:CAF17-like 4Fe-4S cluster assembly/insertion protein YgfZ n=1 Tax=Methylocaldum sp. TaxID=1969727 RepID=UPI002D451DEB|nr:folate-binding protein [Methylocaldum sp.]HYE37183.1 folate-binding protein [Methylocaldum sp.]